MSKLKILFIINPISGGLNKQKAEKIIKTNIDHSKYDSHFVYTKCNNHAQKLAKNAIQEEYDMVVAVGGDGTVNEVVNSLVNTNVKFAVIPCGSGNGLARHLKIPMDIKKAIKIINTATNTQIDTIKINDRYFINVAGIGFDAHISNLFANYKKRGFKNYVKIIVKEFFNYKNEVYKLLINNKIQETEAFVVSFANSTQFGNNAHIAPLAKIDDGLIDICIIKKFPMWQSLILAAKLFTKTIHKSKYYSLIKTDSLRIINSEIVEIHTDGDPHTCNSDINIKVLPKSLNILVP